MTKIIAEFCQNHLGDTEILQKMISSAQINGATHAKIQGLYSDEITKRIQFEDPKGILYRPFQSEYERLKKLDLSFEIEKWFVETCKSQSIIPMITVFTHKGVDRAREAGFKNIKIASYDCASIPLIERVLDFASELVISTGATFWDEIIKTAELISSKKNNNQEIAFLHAKTIYPTRIEQFGLARMLALKSFGYMYGLSDHSKPEDCQLLPSKAAILLGADYLERHFTVLDRGLSKDGPISITPSELSELSRFISLTKSQQRRDVSFEEFQKVFLCDSLEPSDEELLNRSYYRGRVASKYEGKIVYGWEELHFET